ncbi:unnamed protein product [Symbiodinium sp. CCMP2592]|nr:unnamed protein product [Symbiodinium sp. CCMP2592]
MGDDDAVAALAEPSSWARDSRSCLSVSIPPPSRGPQGSYESDLDHWKQCQDAECPRCFFENGFRGQLRRGTSALALENETLAWRNKFTFRHPELGEKCWLAVKPRTFPGGFGIGCWVCAHHPQKYSSSFSRLSVNTKETMGPSAFSKHAQSPSHLAALKDLDAKLKSPEDPASGQVTGQSDVCPRLEKFVLAGQIIARRDSFTDYHEYVKALSVSGVQDVLREVKILFKDQAILHDATGATLTALTLKNLARLGHLTYLQGRSEVPFAIPQGQVEDLRPITEQIYSLFQAFFATQFPNYEEVNAFALFRLDGVLSWPQRRVMLGTIALTESMSADELWKQLVGKVDGEGPSMGLFARAMHYFDNPLAKNKSESVGALRQRFGNTTVAWMQTLQSLDPRQRSARPLAVRVIQKSLAILTGTQNVERFLGEVRLIELKHRARALGNEILADQRFRSIGRVPGMVSRCIPLAALLLLNESVIYFLSGVFCSECQQVPVPFHVDDRAHGVLLHSMIATALGLQLSDWHVSRLSERLPSTPPESYVISPGRVAWYQCTLPVDLRPVGGNIQVLSARRDHACVDVVRRALLAQGLPSEQAVLLRTSKGWFSPASFLLLLPELDSFQVWPITASSVEAIEGDSLPSVVSDDWFRVSLPYTQGSEAALHDTAGSNAVVIYSNGLFFTQAPSFADHLTLRSSVLHTFLASAPGDPTVPLHFARLLPPLDNLPPVQFVAMFCHDGLPPALVDLRPLGGALHVFGASMYDTPAMRIQTAISQGGDPSVHRPLTSRLVSGELLVLHREVIVNPFVALQGQPPLPIVVVARRDNIASGFRTADPHHVVSDEEDEHDEVSPSPLEVSRGWGAVPSSVCLLVACQGRLRCVLGVIWLRISSAMVPGFQEGVPFQVPADRVSDWEEQVGPGLADVNAHSRLAYRLALPDSLTQLSWTTASGMFFLQGNRPFFQFRELLQQCAGRRLGGSFNTDELVLGPAASSEKNVQYRASKFAVHAQQAYREFFGDRQLASRALDRAATRSSAPPPLGRVQKPTSEAQVTLEGERQKHTKAIQDIVAKGQSHHSDLDSVVDALADVAAARTSTKRKSEPTVDEEPQGQSSSSRKRTRTEQVLQNAQKVQEKQIQVVKSLQPGEVVPYMDGQGGVYRQKPPPAAAIDALPAPVLGRLVKVWPANSSVKVPVWHRYQLVEAASMSDVILVADGAFESSLYASTGLLARLHGCRLADMEWARTKMTKGQCISFGTALQSHFYFYLSASFRRAFPLECKALLTAVSESRPSKKGLHVLSDTPFPESPKHPRLTFEVVCEEEATSPHQISLVGLFAKLSSVRRL